MGYFELCTLEKPLGLTNALNVPAIAVIETIKQNVEIKSIRRARLPWGQRVAYEADLHEGSIVITTPAEPKNGIHPEAHITIAANPNTRMGIFVDAGNFVTEFENLPQQESTIKRNEPFPLLRRGRKPNELLSYGWIAYVENAQAQPIPPLLGEDTVIKTGPIPVPARRTPDRIIH